MRQRLTTSLLLAAALLVLLPGLALAHASFDVRQLPAGSSQDLVLRVPLERDAVNDLVEVLVPGAFSVDSCDGAEGWTCEQAETADGDSVLTLSRDPDGPGDTELFAVTVTAPDEEGVYAFPTIQTYDDGVEAPWIGEPGTDAPAPRIQVGDETTEVEFSGDATPHTDLATEEPTAAPTAEPTEDAVDERGEDDATPTAEPTEDESTDDAGQEPADDATEDDLAGGEVGDDGPSTILLVVGALLSLVAIAGAVARFRSV